MSSLRSIWRVLPAAAVIALAVSPPVRAQTLGGASPPVCVAAPQGVTAWYPADGHASDIVSGIGPLPTVPIPASTYAPGLVGQSFLFDGSTQAAILLGVPAASADLTYEFWIKTASSRDETVLSTRTSCGTLGVPLLQTAGNSSAAWWEIRTAGGAVALDLVRVDQSCIIGSLGDGPTCTATRRRSSMSSIRTVNDGAFHHVAFTRAGPRVAVFIDGLLDATADGSTVDSFDAAGSLTASSPSADPVDLAAAVQGPIGAAGSVPCQTPFTGQLDEITFYSRALAPQEIQPIAAAGSGGKCKNLVWGYKFDGQLGDGTTGGFLARPESLGLDAGLAGLPPLTKVRFSEHFGLALTRDGRVYAWGVNQGGNLGLNLPDQTVLTPQVIPGLTDVVDIAVGDTYGLAAKADGTVWAWGSAQHGIGIGDGAAASVPTQVPGVSGVIAVAASVSSMLALRCDGTVLGWGDNPSHQLGTTQVGVDVPFEILGVQDVAAISLMANTSVFLKRDGTVWTMGSSAVGELGNGMLFPNGGGSSVPVQVLNVHDVVAISSAEHAFFTLALQADGTVWGWGHNGEGQLGDGTHDNQPIPVQVMNAGSTPDAPNPLTLIRAIAAGDLHGLAVDANGIVYGWGNNDGALGLSVPDVPHPVAVVGGMSLAAAGGLESAAFGGYPTAVHRTFSCAACTPAPSTGLTAWYAGEGSAADSTSAHRDGSIVGNVLFAPAKTGLGFRFDGSGGYLHLPDDIFPYPQGPGGTTPFGFDAWFSTTAAGVILGQQDRPVDAPMNFAWPAIYVDTVGLVRVQMFYNGTTNQIVSHRTVNDGAFHHLAVSFDGANDVLFIDGVREGSLAMTQAGRPADHFTYQIGTGWMYSWLPSPPVADGWAPFAGTIDEVHIYDHALSDTDVWSVYLAGDGGFCPAVLTPTVTWPSPADITAGTPLGPSQLDATASVSGSFAYDPPAGTVLAAGPHALHVTFTPDDATHYSQATASVTLDVVQTPPTLMLPADMTVVATGASGSVVNYVASATDVVDGSLVPSCAPATGSTFPVGTTIVGCSATNSGGLTATGSFSVMVVPQTAAISVTERITVTDSVALLPSAMIAVAEKVTVTDSVALLPSAMISIAEKITVADAFIGPPPPVVVNIAEHVYVTDVVTVLPSVMLAIAETVRVTDSTTAMPRDTAPPVLTFPSAITAIAPSARGVVITFTVSAVDAVDGPTAVLCSMPSGSLFPIGMTVVTCSSTDRAGNRAAGAFTVTVLTPAQAIAELIVLNEKAGLQAGLAVLENALASIVRGSHDSACGQIGAFINQVKAQAGRKLTEAQARELVDRAAAISAALGC